MAEQKQVTFTLNGQRIVTPAGTLVIEAAKKQGVEVPSFCYYPGVTPSSVAACRMCLVEVEKMPKLQTACTLVATEGMVVRSDTEQVHKARKDMIEFLLSNHPLDCPVCDKGGEGELQDMTFRYGMGESRFLEQTQHTDEQQWSPVVFYDKPRCILCYRCVRICDEGMGVKALGVGNRGSVSIIEPNGLDHLECDECGMCIDICPVGALTSGTYRYKTRPWEMKHIGTICTHCADGCKTTLGVRNNEIIRGNNRDRSGINGEFLCIKGRYAADFVNSPERLQSPMIRKNGSLTPVSWSEALTAAARKLGEVKAGNGQFAVIGSNHTSNEENYYLQKFARQALGTDNIDHHRTGDIATLLDSLSGKKEALATTADLYDRKAILVVSSDLSQQHPFLAFQIRANYRHHGAHVYTVTPGPVREQSIALRGILTVSGRELADVESLSDQLKNEPELVIVFGDAIKGDRIRQLGAFGDSRGASDMGLSPDAGPGYQPVSISGLAYDEILAATDLDVVWVVGANPLKEATIASTGAFVIVQDLFMTETASRADILFPAASAYEKHGTVTNVCGEVQRLKGGVQVMGAKPDLDIFGLLSKEMGVNLVIWSADKVFEEIRKNVHGYNIPLPVLATGGASQTAPVNGRVPVSSRPELIQSAGDTLFTSGTLGRYCKKLNSTLEAPGALYSEPRP